MNSEPNDLARILKVLSVGTRVRIVQLLRHRVLCVNALAMHLDVTQGAVSQHLRIMRDAALVIDERRGYHVHYRLNEETLARWRAEIDALLAPLDRGPANENLPAEGDRPCPAMRNSKVVNGRRT